MSVVSASVVSAFFPYDQRCVDTKQKKQWLQSHSGKTKKDALLSRHSTVFNMTSTHILQYVCVCVAINCHSGWDIAERAVIHNS